MEHSSRKCLIVSMWFPHVACWSFLDIKCPWIEFTYNYLGCLEILYMWYCFSIYTRISVHYFLVLAVDHILLYAAIILINYSYFVMSIKYLIVCIGNFIVTLSYASSFIFFMAALQNIICKLVIIWNFA